MLSEEEGKCFRESKYLTAWDEQVYSKKNMDLRSPRTEMFSSSVIKHKWRLEFQAAVDFLDARLVFDSSPAKDVIAIFTITIEGDRCPHSATYKHCFNREKDKVVTVFELTGTECLSNMSVSLVLRTEIEKDKDHVLPALLDVRSPLADFSDDMASAVDDVAFEKFSDVVVAVGERKIAAHQVVLAARSPVFTSMFSSEMLEKANKCVKIEDFTEDVVVEFLKYLYSSRPPEFTYELATELMKAAEKYQVLKLKSLCDLYLIGQLSTTNVVELLYLGDVYRSKVLKDKALVFIRQHLKSIQDAEKFSLLDSRPELLRDIIAEVAKDSS